MKKAIIISGAAGSGKSTICNMLKQDNYSAYDSGELFRWLDYKHSKPELYHHDCMLKAMAKNDAYFILCTCMNPLEYKLFKHKLCDIIEIHFISLSASSAVIRKRLESRPPTRGYQNSDAIKHQLEYNKWYLTHPKLFEINIDTSVENECDTYVKVTSFINSVVGSP